MSTAIDPFSNPAWFGSESYREFAQSVKNDLRYVRSVSANQFLDEVRIIANSSSRKARNCGVPGLVAKAKNSRRQTTTVP
jgi:hypothetical protein